MPVKEFEGTPKRPGRKGYVTRVFTGPDGLRKAKGIRDKQAKEARAKKDAIAAKENVHAVRNFAGTKRLVSERSLKRIQALQKSKPWLYPKGPPASRVSVSIGAHIKNGRVVRDDEEG